MTIIKNSCSCEKCVGCCERNPGWMNPKEAQIAIQKGFAKKLMRDWLQPCKEYGNAEKIYVLAPASIGYEAIDAPEMTIWDFITGMNKGEMYFFK